jgi:hypothetical protein
MPARRHDASENIPPDLRSFYDPHIGFAGATAPLPAPIKVVADALDGARMSLKGAVKILETVASGLGGEVRIKPDHGMLTLTWSSKANGDPIHHWRVIRYR